MCGYLKEQALNPQDSFCCRLPNSGFTPLPKDSGTFAEWKLHLQRLCTTICKKIQQQRLSAHPDRQQPLLLALISRMVNARCAIPFRNDPVRNPEARKCAVSHPSNTPDST